MKLHKSPWSLPMESSEERRERLARRRLQISLSLLSGLMLGLAFPPSPVGTLACFGLIPLLIVLADLDRLGPTLRATYLAMLVFHAITLAWTGGFSHAHDLYMMIAGSVTILVHPLFYFLPITLYWWVKKSLGPKAALWALPAIWLAYEYSHSLSQWSFPWLTLGNTQTYDLARMQMASSTGVWGLSLWILVINVLGFFLYTHLAKTRAPLKSGKTWLLLAAIVLIDLAPAGYGEHVLSGAPPVSEEPRAAPLAPLRVGIVQPNIDPWDKWSMSGLEQISLYLRMTEELTSGKEGPAPEIVLWPETAIPYYLFIKANRPLLEEIRGALERMNVSLLTGVPQVVFYPDSNLAPASSRVQQFSRERYDTFNAAAFIQPGVDSIRWYGKMKMVPFAERIPYADLFQFVGFLRWNVGIGGWQIGRDTVVFTEAKTGARFSTVICYESVYPDFVASFVRRGAEFLTIITIDSWWGRMSGAFQHEQFALLRAIENRRWVARCALGGISCFIDPYGRTFEKTELFTRRIIAHDVGRSRDLTPYTRYGDWLPLVCVWFTGAFLAATFGARFLKKRRNELWTTTS